MKTTTDKFWIFIYYLISVLVLVLIIGMFAFVRNVFAHNRTPLPPQVKKSLTKPKTSDTFTAKITYYNSTPGQTSGNPFIMADGTHVYFGAVAATCLPFGTRLRIPKLYGSKIFTVHDRGGFGCNHVDVWLPVGQRFGTLNTKVEVVR